MRAPGWPAAGGMLLVLALAACGPAGGASVSGNAPSTAAAPTEAAPTEAAPTDQQEETIVPLWLPAPGASWQWQLSGPLDLSVEAEIFDVDYETTTSAEIDSLKEQGRHTVCYLSVGSWEDYRSDAGEFPASVLGDVMSGWPDERWLDIRRMDVLLPIMAARMDTCTAKGFDAVEPDNVDGYQNETGFPLTEGEQLAYNRAVAELAHSRGLSVALKNDVDQIPELVNDFDFAVNEECIRYEECDKYKPFADAGKAVLHVEYEGTLSFCAESKERGLSSMLKPLDLGAPREAC